MLQVLNATEYYLPLYFQSVKEASPLRSGVLLLPQIVSAAVVGVATGVFVHQVGRYIELIWVGVTLLTIGSGLYIHLNATSSIVSLVISEIVTGAGAGLLFDPNLIALQALVSQDDTATATATLEFMRNVGMSVSIVAGGILFQNGMQLQRPSLQEAGLPMDLVISLSGTDAATNIDLIPSIANDVQKLAVKEAFAWSLRNFWIMCTCMAACGILASPFITKTKLAKEHTETRTGMKKENVITRILSAPQRSV